jgi:hemin uptake protein HemP
MNVEEQTDFSMGNLYGLANIKHETQLESPQHYILEQQMFAGKSFTIVTREGKIVLPKSLQ